MPITPRQAFGLITKTESEMKSLTDSIDVCLRGRCEGTSKTITTNPIRIYIDQFFPKKDREYYVGRIVSAYTLLDWDVMIVKDEHDGDYLQFVPII